MAERKQKKSLKARATEALQDVLKDAVEALNALLPAPTPVLVPVRARAHPPRRVRR